MNLYAALQSAHLYEKTHRGRAGGGLCFIDRSAQPGTDLGSPFLADRGNLSGSRTRRRWGNRENSSFASFFLSSSLPPPATPLDSFHSAIGAIFLGLFHRLFVPLCSLSLKSCITTFFLSRTCIRINIWLFCSTNYRSIDKAFGKCACDWEN